MAVEIELRVPCTHGSHSVRVRMESWHAWEVVASDCMELMGRAFGRMAVCYQNTLARGVELRCQAVAQLAQGRVVPLLIQALQDEDEDVRVGACEALGEIGDASAVPALISALRDRDEDLGIRLAVCRALVKIGKPAVPALIDVLGDKSAWVRAAVCRSLGEIGDASAVPALIQALGDRWVRDAVCEALGAIGDASAVPALIQALRDRDWDVHKAVQEALRRIEERQKG